MAMITVNEDTCKGCGLCVDACPKTIMEINKEHMNKKGYHPAHCAALADCIGCAFCAMMCPDVAITVEK